MFALELQIKAEIINNRVFEKGKEEYTPNINYFSQKNQYSEINLCLSRNDIIYHHATNSI